MRSACPLDRFYGEFMNTADRQMLVTALDEIEKAAGTAHRAGFTSAHTGPVSAGIEPTPLSQST
jgi:hypothetical protein